MESTDSGPVHQGHPALREVVRRAINAADPIGLLGIGAPEDEYDPEIRTVVPRLPGAASALVVRTILHEEFAAWFAPVPWIAGSPERYEGAGQEIAGSPERYEEAAQEIWEFLQAFSTHYPDDWRPLALRVAAGDAAAAGEVERILLEQRAEAAEVPAVRPVAVTEAWQETLLALARQVRAAVPEEGSEEWESNLWVEAFRDARYSRDGNPGNRV